jgi:hypothetical protein
MWLLHSRNGTYYSYYLSLYYYYYYYYYSWAVGR